MSLLIRSITNTSSVEPINLVVPGYDPANPVVVGTSATLDLLSVMSTETLHAMQGELSALVADGSATVAASIPSADLWPAALGTYLAASDTQVVFNPTSISATHTAGATVAVQVENAAGAIDFLDSTTTVTVAASGSHTPLINGLASPQTVTVSGGVASLLITDNLADSVTLSITANSRSLTQSSTCAVTLS